MKRILALLCAMLLLMAVPLASAENDVRNNTAVRNNRQYVDYVLKRGKTLDAWVFPFKTTTGVYLSDKDDDQILLKSVKLSGAKGKIRISLSDKKGWIKAKLNSNKITFAISGKNTSTANKLCKITIRDSKGIFGYINVTRGGTMKITSIKQVGKKIQIKINGASENLGGVYMRKVVFNSRGKVVSNSYGEYLKRLSNVLFEDSEALKKGYVYTYCVGYFRDGINCAWCNHAAGIKINKVNAKKTGRTMSALNDDQLCYNDEWLFKIAK